MFFLGVAASSFCVRAFGQKDPSRVVIDEVVGFMITMFCIPCTFRTVLLGFFIFRLADIIKPFPARRSEKLPSGWGIMMDDVWAGVYGNILLRIIWHFWIN
jgi:phosphatidylglycerophosphatase A